MPCRPVFMHNLKMEENNMMQTSDRPIEAPTVNASAKLPAYDPAKDIAKNYTRDIKRKSFRGYPQDGESLKEMIDIQEQTLAAMKRHNPEAYIPGIARASFSAPDHPMTDFFNKYHREDEETNFECELVHSVGNTERGIPEVLILNMEAEYASSVIARFTQAWDSMGHEMLGKFIHEEDCLLYPHMITDHAALRPYDSESGTLAAMELRLGHKNETSKWIQLIYSDERWRMPWDPGNHKEAYQPIIGMRPTRTPAGGVMVQ